MVQKTRHRLPSPRLSRTHQQLLLHEARMLAKCLSSNFTHAVVKQLFLKTEKNLFFFICQMILLIKFSHLFPALLHGDVRVLLALDAGKPTPAKSNRPKQQQTFHHRFNHRDCGCSVVRQLVLNFGIFLSYKMRVDLGRHVSSM